MKNRTLFLSLVIAWLLSPAQAEFPGLPIDRTLIDATGRRLEATILTATEDDIRIRRKSDGKEFDLPLERLSQKDRDWLDEMRENKVQDAATPKPNKPDPDPAPSLPRPKPTPEPEPKLEQFPKPVPISNEAILAEQIERGMVPPPAGRTALQTTVRFTDRRVIPGYVYDVKDGQFWYAAADLVQKKAALSKLEPLSRLALENWIEQKKPRTSPTMTFILEGEEIHASVLHADEKQVTLQKEPGELLERVPLKNLDEIGQNFIAEWTAGRWKPDKWEWAVDAQFTAVQPFFRNGHALVKKDQKWGIIDLKGAYVEQPRFEHVEKMPNSMNMKVFENGKWGLLNEVAKLALPPAWEDVGDLQHGLIPVKSQGKWGYAAEGGELVIRCVWDEAWQFSDVGTAVVTLDGKRGFVDRTGKVIVKPEWDGAIGHTPEGIGAVRRGAGWALVNREGQLLSDPIWNFRWSERRFELGFIPAWPMNGLKGLRSQGGPKTFLGIDGKPGAIPKLRKGVCLPGSANTAPRLQKNTEPSTQGFPFPRIDEKKGKIGLIDLAGNVIFPPQYDVIHMVTPNIFSLKKGEESRIVTAQRKVLVEGDLATDGVEKLEHSPSFQANVGGKILVFWLDGTPVLPEGRDNLVFVDSYGADLIFRDGPHEAPKSWWRVDSKTRELHPIEGASRIYWVKSLADYQRIWLQDKDTKRWHFCTISGERLGLEMEQQPSAWFFDEGFGVMWENATCYFVNQAGKRLDFGVWEDASFFKNGLCSVKKDGKWGFIDSSGEQIAPCEYDEVGHFFVAAWDADVKQPMLAAVSKSGKWGYINPRGEIIIPLVGDRQGYWDLWNRRGIYLYAKESGGVYYDPQGNKVDPKEYFQRSRETELSPKEAGNRLVTRSNGRMGLKDETGRVVLENQWQAIAWLAPEVYVVRGEGSGGLYSLKKGWLFRDDDQYGIQRHSGEGRMNLRWSRHGFLLTEETPRWGYARWKNLTPVDGLLAHYALDGNTEDSSGMENHSIYRKTQWTEDKHGNPRSAILLDGSEEFVSCPLGIEPSAAPQVTLVAWARADGEGPWRHVIGLMHNRSIEIAGGWVGRGTAGKWGCFGHRKLNVGEWVFIAASYDEDNNSAILQVNDETFKSNLNGYRRRGSFRLGGDESNTAFKGAIDEVRVYNRLLTKEELDRLYQQFLGSEP